MADLPMTHARWLILACGVPVALAIIAAAAGAWVHAAVRQLVNLDSVGYSVSLTAPLTAGQAKVTTNNASLTVAPGPGGRIGVHGRLAGPLGRPIFSHTVTSTGLMLSARCRAPVGNCSLGLDVAVPAGAPADIADSYGNIQVTSLHGAVRVADNSGDIDASHLTDGAALTDSSGNINASDLSGPTRLNDISGDINITTLTGDSQLKDSYGNVIVQGLSAAGVRCTNNSGDITISFTTVPRDVTVKDSYGNITLELPPGSAAYDVHAANHYGGTHVTVPQDASSPNVITATNNSGDITIINQ